MILYCSGFDDFVAHCAASENRFLKKKKTTEQLSTKKSTAAVFHSPAHVGSGWVGTLKPV
jgi:hypothetical protein